MQQALEEVHAAALEGIRASLKTVEEQIHQLVQQEQAIKNNYDLLVSVPGIGHLTALPCTLIGLNLENNST